MNEPPVQPQQEIPPPRLARRSRFANPWVWAFFAGIVTLTLIRPLLRHEPAPPPVVGQLPQFTLTDTNGRPFGSHDLRDHVWVANFIFTRCTSICPLLTRSMARLQKAYGEAGVDEIVLVSVSVDPEFDTPERLAEYAAAHAADPRRWHFLTGDPAEVRKLVVAGFKTALGEPFEQDGNLIDIAHTGKFVLVDGDGGIRGYYDSDDDGLDELFSRSRHVLRERRRAR